MNYDKICLILRAQRGNKTNRVINFDWFIYDHIFTHEDLDKYILKFLNTYGQYWIVYNPNDAVPYTYWANLNYDCAIYLAQTTHVYNSEKHKLAHIKLISVNEDLVNTIINTAEKLEDIL